MPKPTDAEILLNAWTEAPLEIPFTVSFRKRQGKPVVIFDVADYGYVTMTAEACRDLAATVAGRVNQYPLLYRSLRYFPGFLRAMADRAAGWK